MAPSIGPNTRGEKLVAGVDGCRGGWLVCLAATEGPRPCIREWIVCPDARSMRRITQPCLAVAVDMPIGLHDRPVAGGRACERLARALLPRERKSSVFPAPTRAHLAYLGNYSALRAAFPAGSAISKQAYNIMPRIAELDAAIGPRVQKRIFEAHPELAFQALQGGPLPAGKRTPAGQAARKHLLEAAMDGMAGVVAAKRACGARVATDDLYDAAVLVPVALRHLRGEAVRLPEDPPRDARGLRMEISY